MNQRLIGGPRQESSYDVSVGDVGQLVALPGEVSNVPTKNFPKLLSVVFEIPWVSRTRVCALEVSHEISFRSAQLWIQLGGRCSNHIRAESARNNERLRIIKLSLSAPPAWQAS